MIRKKKEPAGWGTAPAEACLVHRGKEEDGRERNETGEEETGGGRKHEEIGIGLLWASWVAVDEFNLAPNHVTVVRDCVSVCKSWYGSGFYALNIRPDG